MRKKTLAAFIVFTFILTMFVFYVMYSTRPESNSYTLQVLEEARNRQNMSLVSVDAPLNTDTYQMTQEERIAKEVAAILSEDASFASDVKDMLITDAEAYMNGLASTVRSEVLSQSALYTDTQGEKVLSEASGYSDSIYDKAIEDSSKNTLGYIAEAEARIEGIIDSRVSASFEDDIKEYVSGEVKAISASDRAYTDSQTSRIASSASDRILKDSSFLSAVSAAVISRLGISQDGEYILEVDRLVDEVLNALLQDPELLLLFKESINDYYNENSQYIYDSHVNELIKDIQSLSDEEVFKMLDIAPISDSNFVNSESKLTIDKSETAPVISQKTESAAPSKTAEPAVEKERVSAPVFGVPNTSLTDEQITVERENLRNEEINRILEWLGE
ncbi:MAG: hypothetical protein II339_03345 [Spirochaetales bacterium]|nr:hypothetical protein [Spirochaetales bacterium]